MTAAMPAPMASLTRPEAADLRCKDAEAGVAVVLGRREQQGWLARQDSGGAAGSVGLGLVGLARWWWRPDAGMRGGLRLLLAALVRPQHLRTCCCLPLDHSVAF